jgi:hypothetical protein
VAIKTLIMLCIGIVSATANMKAMQTSRELICTCSFSRIITGALNKQLATCMVYPSIHRKRIAELLCKGADPNVLDGCGLPLVAQLLNDYELSKFFLEHDTDPNKKSTMEKQTILHLIMKREAVNAACLSLLCEHKADVNALDVDHNTPLHILAENCWRYSQKIDLMLQKAEWLCQHSAWLTKKNKAANVPYEITEQKIYEGERRKVGIAPAKILASFLRGAQSRGLKDVLP